MPEALKEKLAALKRPGRARKPRGTPLAPGRAAIGIDTFLPGGELLTEFGAIYVHERRRSELDKGLGMFLRRLARVEKRALKFDVHADFARLLSEGLPRAVFVDLETTGLAGSPVFIVGAMTAEPTDWTLRQFIARNYAEEEALVRHAMGLLAQWPILVTFNGRSFDWPFLKTRAAYHRIPLPPDPFHVDLLPHARRHWKGEFDNCKLQTLEWRVVGRRRTGDVGGAEIPGRYHDYVKSGDPYPLAPVFHHNMLDLVAMADILVAMLEREAGGEIPPEESEP